MQNISDNNKRIAKNTLYMYLRMFITMCIGLYTSRMVLKVLGIEDYGLYNVIGGIIAMLGFVNGAMSNATSRYLAYTIGKKDGCQLRKVFSQAMMIHMMIALLIIVLGETIGLWYLHNKLVVPEGRMYAAEWLYQLTIASAILDIISVPYRAIIIAYERMNVFAYFSIVDVFLKLIVVFVLIISPFDKLIFYGSLIFLIYVFDRIIYGIYCNRNFEETKIHFSWDKALFYEMSSYAGWNIFGTFSYLFYSQGINLMLNFFCGPTVNAARGISHQVESLVKQFASNVQTAINPQIIKSYAAEDMSRMYTLIYASSRYCFYLLFILSLPIFIEASFILEIWLGHYPEHTVNFVRIMLAYVTLDTLINPMWAANNATGKVKFYQICISINSYLFIPLTYIAISFTNVPESVFICLLLSRIVGVVIRILVLRKNIGLSVLLYIRYVLLRILSVVVVSSILPIFMHQMLPHSAWNSIFIVVACGVSAMLGTYTIGMDGDERKFVRKRVENILKQKISL